MPEDNSIHPELNSSGRRGERVVGEEEGAVWVCLIFWEGEMFGERRIVRREEGVRMFRFLIVL